MKYKAKVERENLILGRMNRRVVLKVSPERNSSSIPSAKEASAGILCLVSDTAFRRGSEDQTLKALKWQ